MSLPPFHVAIGVDSIEQTRQFYVEVLGCSEGRSAETWIDLSLFGHQLSAHLCPGSRVRAGGQVDGDAVPIPHIGAVLPWERWEALAARVREAGVAFLLEPRVRFAGEVGEQGTFFIQDPAGNGLEFKAFRDPDQLFENRAR